MSIMGPSLSCFQVHTPIVNHTTHYNTCMAFCTQVQANGVDKSGRSLAFALCIQWTPLLGGFWTRQHMSRDKFPATAIPARKRLRSPVEQGARAGKVTSHWMAWRVWIISGYQRVESAACLLSSRTSIHERDLVTILRYSSLASV